MRVERLSFFVESVEAVPEGWRLEGVPGYHPINWARPGDRFDQACRENGGDARDVALVVVELSESCTVVRGTGGDLLRSDDIISGERLTDDSDAGVGLLPWRDATESLAAILGLTPLDGRSGTGFDWSSVERELGAVLPPDYKRFVDGYGAGLVDGHITVCAPDAPHDWADLVPHNTWAQQCVRLDFAGPEKHAGDWPVGDPTYWTPDREYVPSWFEPGDELISWGHTGNGDLLFWHVEPGTAASDWPVVMKEEGPYWEQYPAGFSSTLASLLTGKIQSKYLSHWLGGPHSYRL
ncbi:SMI1/KNR4 family protein [Cryptosporangium arvum]|uniref:SMI1/KNR4 family protein n=1 Tax=Cryptosporangium arvum TaxID=80871 RepID=UPI001B802EED|nr:hypothetical protein [Cryptosporangium arvum]